MNDSRPRNSHGQFAPDEQGGMDPNTTSAAYNPQIIEARKASLAEKLRRAIGLRRGVEETVPQQQQLSAKLRLRELAQRQVGAEEDPALGRAGSLLLAGGVGTVGNLAAVTAAKGVLAAKKQQGLDLFGQPHGSEVKPMMAWGGTTEEANEKLRKATEEVNARNRKVQREYLRSNPDARRSEVLDRFARRKGYDIAAGDPGVAPKGSVPGKKRGIFQRGHADPDFIRAHEAGHVAQNLGGKKLPLTNISRQAFMLAPLGAASALVNKDKSNDKVATGIAAAGTLAALPTLHNEVDASVRGYKIMRKLGSTRLRAAGAFAGVPTYATIAAMPALGWGARKLRQARSEKKESKQLSAKLRLRELARSTSTRGAVPAPPAEPGQTGRDLRNAAIGVGALGAGGGVAYAGWHRAQADKSVRALADDALRTAEARKAERAARMAKAKGVGSWFKKAASKMFQEDMKNTNKLRLRELARVAAQPEEERKGGIGKVGAIGLGLGLGIGGGVAGARYLRPILQKNITRAADGVLGVSEAAKQAIPKMATEVENTARSVQSAVLQATRNIDDATVIPRTAGKVFKSEVLPRAWNAMNILPSRSKLGGWRAGERWKEIRSGVDAGMEESQLRRKYVDRIQRRAAARGVSQTGMKGARQQAKLKQAAVENIPAGTVPGYQAWRPSWAREEPARVKLAGPKAGAKLYSAKLRLRELAEVSCGLKEFAEEKQPLSLKQKLGIAAGVGTAAVGATLMPAAGKMFRIATRDMAHETLTGWAKKRGLRRFIKPPKSDPNRDGRFVADYIDGAQSILNKGIRGQIAGKILQHAKANPNGKVAQMVGGRLGDYGVSHYARFRSGPREAMKHWDSEVGDLKNHLGKQDGILDAANNFVPGANPAKVKNITRRRAQMDAGRKAVDDEINQQLWHHGKNEAEALRHVAENTKNPAALQYFKNLAHHNKGAAQKYAKMSLAAPGLIVAGGATAGLSARQKKDFASKVRLRELARRGERDIGGDVARGAGTLGGVGLLGAGGVAAARAINPYVAMTHGYKKNEYSGHLSASRKAKDVLEKGGVKVKMAGSEDGFMGGVRGVFGSVEGRSGYGMQVPFAKHINSHPDVFDKSHDIPVGMPSKVTSAIGRNTKKTIGVYGGSVGVDVADKIPGLAKMAKDVDAIHLYAGAPQPKAAYIPGGLDRTTAALEKLRETDPEAAKKFKIHSTMNPKAYKNAMRAHTINISNTSGNTLQEIATTDRPFVVWNQHADHGKIPHFKGNREWYESRGANVVQGDDELARSNDAAARLKEIISKRGKNETAGKLAEESAKRQAAFVGEAKSFLKKSRIRNSIAAAGLGLGGAGLIAATHWRNRKKK